MGYDDPYAGQADPYAGKAPNPYAPGANPYQAPQAEVYVRPERGPSDRRLPSPWLRLLARIVDGCLQMICLLPMVVPFIWGAAQGGRRIPDEAFIGAAVVCGLLFLGLLIANLYLLAINGQTIGKRLVSVKIADINTGQTAPLSKILLLRIVVMAILESLPLGIGLIVSLLNALMIFRDGHRCLHDELAGTIVVYA